MGETEDEYVLSSGSEEEANSLSTDQGKKRPKTSRKTQSKSKRAKTASSKTANNTPIEKQNFDSHFEEEGVRVDLRAESPVSIEMPSPNILQDLKEEMVSLKSMVNLLMRNLAEIKGLIKFQRATVPEQISDENYFNILRENGLPISSKPNLDDFEKDLESKDKRKVLVCEKCTCTFCNKIVYQMCKIFLNSSSWTH